MNIINVPFQMSRNNRRYLTELQLVEEPALRDFVMQFPACFAQEGDIYWFND